MTGRKAGMQEVRNDKKDAEGNESRFLVSCLPAFLNSIPGRHIP
jgi:hypothetical protein